MLARTMFCAVAMAATASLGACAGVQAWFAPSAMKVLRDAKPSPAAKWDLAAARNEVEACQLVLVSDAPVTGLRVTVSDLLGKNGRKLRAELRKVDYVFVDKDKTYYPDPLPPLTALDLKPNEAQPVWISVSVPSNAAPGVYRGAVEVGWGARRSSYPLSVKVWDFALPVTPSCTTAFGIDRESIVRLHGLKAASGSVDGESREAKDLYAKYYDALLDHKISAYCIPAELTSSEAEKYLNDPRMTSFMIPYTDDDALMKQTVNRLLNGGWFSKGYYYPLDEPVTKDAYEALEKITTRLRRLDPNYWIVTPYYTDADFGDKLPPTQTLLGKVNIWCPNSGYHDTSPESRRVLAMRKNAGDTVWWYVCCGPGEPYANLWVNQNAAAHRMLFWQQKNEGIDGLLYWSTTYWKARGGLDPWQDIRTYAEIYGDGSLFYPGKRVGIDGPVSSLRLEVIRDGIEDFDYLTLAEQRIGRDTMRGYIARCTKSPKDYEHGPMKIEKVRRDLGDALERATKEARKRL